MPEMQALMLPMHEDSANADTMINASLLIESENTLTGGTAIDAISVANGGDSATAIGGNSVSFMQACRAAYRRAPDGDGPGKVLVYRCEDTKPCGLHTITHAPGRD